MSPMPKRAPPLGHFVPKARIEMLREFVSSAKVYALVGDGQSAASLLQQVEDMLTLILEKAPVLPVKAWEEQ